MKSVKNGKIEFFRFAFCIAVLLFHIEKYLMGEPELGDPIHFSLFAHGSLGVEFFFLTSGYFMARSVYKKIKNEDDNRLSDQNRSRTYTQFIAHKYKRIFGQHAIAFIIAFATYTVVVGLSGKETIIFAIRNIPSFFLIQMSGLNLSNVNHIEWYLSAMMIAMVVLFPLFYNHYYSFLHYWGPFIALIGIGYFQFTTGSLTGVMVWTGVTYKSVLRAIFEITLGGTLFEITRWLSSLDLKSYHRLLFAIIELIVFVFSVVFMMTTWEKTYEIYVLVMLMVLIILAGSDAAKTNRIFNNRICYFLGDISLAVYLSQLTAIYYVTNRLSAMPVNNQCIVCVVITFVVAMIVWGIDKLFQKYWAEKAKKKAVISN